MLQKLKAGAAAAGKTDPQLTRVTGSIGAIEALEAIGATGSTEVADDLEMFEMEVGDGDDPVLLKNPEIIVKHEPDDESYDPSVKWLPTKKRRSFVQIGS